jgi:hypothetical protein
MVLRVQCVILLQARIKRRKRKFMEQEVESFCGPTETQLLKRKVPDGVTVTTGVGIEAKL